MYQNCCKKCGSVSLHTEVKGNNTGLYCDDCGAWVKWLGKDELRAFEHSKKNQVFVQMRDSTPEENKAISEYIKSISKPTGINILDDKSIVQRLNEFVEYLDRKIDSEYEKLPLSSEDTIRKNSYCLALEQDKNAILNILRGYDFNYIGNKDDKEMDYKENETPKYIKKKKSSVSKAKEKSKHKHEYVDCLLIEDEGKPHKAAYCKICGKVGDVKFCETEKTDHGTYRMLNKEEVFEKYKNLLQIHIKDIFQKYLPIDVKELK